MAKNNGNKNKSTTSIPDEVLEAREALIEAEDLGVEPEEGFEELYGERVTGWFVAASGNVLQGILRDSFETDSNFRARKGEEKKKRKVYKIEVTKVDEKHPTVVIPAEPANDDESVNGVHAQVGDLVGLDEKGFLKALGKCTAGQEVWVACLGKLPRSADFPQGAWKYIVRAKPVAVDQATGEVSSAAARARRVLADDDAF